MTLPRTARPGIIRLDKQFSDTLAELAQKVQNCRRGTAGDQVTLYRVAVQEIFATLTSRLHPDDVQDLVVTESYVALMSGNGTTFEQIGLEIDALARRLEAMASDVAAEARRWMWAGSAIVPDTSIFVEVLRTETPIAGEDWKKLAGFRKGQRCSVVIPLTVVSELDDLKRFARDGERRKRARRALRELEELLGGEERSTLVGDLDLTVLVPGLDHRPLPVADAEIIDQALQLDSRLAPGESAKLLSADLSMVLQGRLAGLDCVSVDRPPPETG